MEVEARRVGCGAGRGKALESCRLGTAFGGPAANQPQA